MNNSRIAGILTKLLSERGMRVTELARQVNVPQPTIHRIITGVCESPHLSSLKPIADFFSITVEQLKGLDPIGSFDHTSKVPLLNWNEAVDWPSNRSKLKKRETLLTDASISPNAYALIINDASMEPVFPKGTQLVVDPAKPPKDRSYVIAKLENLPEPIFRQLLVDGSSRYLKPLTPDLERYKMTLINNNDKILSTLVQAKRDYED